MGHFLIVFEGEDRLIDNTDLMACLSDASLEQGGPVLAEGFSGRGFQVGIGDFGRPARFLDRRSAENAVHYLTQGLGEAPERFRVVPEG